MPKVRQAASSHNRSGWSKFNADWELKESDIKLTGWASQRRVVLARRRLARTAVLGLQYDKNGQQQMDFLEGPEDMRLYEYSVLVTNLDSELISIMQHYRDRADCENNFDEIKNQWGWGGFVTKELQTSQIMARTVALIYNWWNLFVRLAIPHKHHEAISSRPLLLSSIGRMTESARQTQIKITSTHADKTTIQQAYDRVIGFFTQFKLTAMQLPLLEQWRLIVMKAMEIFMPQPVLHFLPEPT